MALLSEKDAKFLRDHFSKELVEPVKLLYFTQSTAISCRFCTQTQEILTEFASLSDKITLETRDLVADKDLADEYGIDKIPATVIMGDVDYGIRFYGIPSGYEFMSLVEDVVNVSKGTSGISEESMKLIDEIKEPVHLQVFITPTCPYCPTAVLLAHSLAIASDKIRADMVEATEFPELSNKYQVYGVPRTVINEDTYLEGAAPEPMLVAKVLEALGMVVKE